MLVSVAQHVAMSLMPDANIQLHLTSDAMVRHSEADDAYTVRPYDCARPWAPLPMTTSGHLPLRLRVSGIAGHTQAEATLSFWLGAVHESGHLSCIPNCSEVAD